MLYKYIYRKDKLVKVSEPVNFYKRLELFAGLTKSEVDKEIADKIRILKYLTDKSITDNEEIAMLVNYYYINKNYLMKKLFGGKNS